MRTAQRQILLEPRAGAVPWLLMILWPLVGPSPVYGCWGRLAAGANKVAGDLIPLGLIEGQLIPKQAATVSLVRSSAVASRGKDQQVAAALGLVDEIGQTAMVVADGALRWTVMPDRPARLRYWALVLRMLPRRAQYHTDDLLSASNSTSSVIGRHNYLRVDVKNPQFKVIVEIRDYGAYIHGPKIQGEGGLPVGTSGRALNMLSGGIDSPVAAYRMAKRGLGLDHIHFASPPYTSERAKLKVKALAQLITPYTGSTNLFVVPYTKPQEYIRDNAPDVLFTVLMRRSMMRIANIIARKQGCEALVTGESLAQVASQTVKALQCTDAAQDLPILRPLIGMDKTEIVETARHINTFETSILPYEDCCTIFTPPHPKIRPELSEILEAEAGMPGLAELEAEAAEATERIRLRITDDVEFEG